MNINLKGHVLHVSGGGQLDDRAAKENLEDYRPRIVNISSMSAYTSSVNRGGILHFQGGHLDDDSAVCRPARGVRQHPVFEVRPGIIMTDMTAGVHEKYQKLIDEGRNAHPPLWSAGGCCKLRTRGSQRPSGLCHRPDPERGRRLPHPPPVREREALC